jgi:hypothetical protein
MHKHHHHHGNGAHSHAHEHDHHHESGLGHNHAALPRKTAQWQTPHRVPDDGHVPSKEDSQPDLDLVEAAFVEGFSSASDPTSFLRLANIPFEINNADGTRLVLLRVESSGTTHVGTVTPHLGGASFRYDPLPACMIARERGLRFVYFDGVNLRNCSLAEVREGEMVPGAESSCQPNVLALLEIF